MKKATFLFLLAITTLAGSSFKPADKTCYGYCWAYSYDHKELYITPLYNYSCEDISNSSATSQWRKKLGAEAGSKSSDFSTGANHASGATYQSKARMDGERNDEIARWKGEGFKVKTVYWSPAKE